MFFDEPVEADDSSIMIVDTLTNKPISLAGIEKTVDLVRCTVLWDFDAMVIPPGNYEIVLDESKIRS